MINERLKKLRLDNNLKQKDVCEELHIDKSTYSKYEKGSLTPSLEILDKLSKFYNVTADYILGNIETPITLDELKLYKEIPHKTNEELMKEYDMIGDNDREISKEEIVEILDYLRANYGKKDEN